MPRETFLADATDIVGTTRLDLPSQDWWWSVAFKHPLYPGRMRDTLETARARVGKPVLKEVDNEIVAESSHLAWMISRTSCTARDHVDKVSKFAGDQSVARTVRVKRRTASPRILPMKRAHEKRKYVIPTTLSL
jgi:hypothetical protein